MIIFLSACSGTQTIIRNIDDNAPIPVLKGDAFVITEYATDNRYGYDPEFPINCFYKNSRNDEINQKRFLAALTGPKGEKLFYKKLESCCPFSTKRSEMGAGFLDVYEITYVGLPKPIRLYFNIYEKGQLKVPVGLELKNKK